MSMAYGPSALSREQNKPDHKGRKNCLRATSGLSLFVVSAAIHYSGTSQHFPVPRIQPAYTKEPQAGRDAVYLIDLGDPVSLHPAISPAFQVSVLAISSALPGSALH